jgi:hypothetical protein
MCTIDQIPVANFDSVFFFTTDQVTVPKIITNFNSEVCVMAESRTDSEVKAPGKGNYGFSYILLYLFRHESVR